MPYGGSRSRSEWVTPEISGGKTKVFLVESWYNSTLALPYRLSHATIYVNRLQSFMSVSHSRTLNAPDQRFLASSGGIIPSGPTN